jgi:hypothetical protein
MAKCPECGGGGKLTCPGRGCIEGRIDCPLCNGGSKTTPGEECDMCGVVGKVDCPYCTGEGLVKCGKCEGSGRVD